MEQQGWEYKVVYVEGWQRVSVEGEETYPESHERNSAFGRRFLNHMGVEGWELVGIQHTRPGCGYFIFKRPLAPGAEPDLSVVRRSTHPERAGEEQRTGQNTPTA